MNVDVHYAAAVILAATSGRLYLLNGSTTPPPECRERPTARRICRPGSSHRHGKPDFSGMWGWESARIVERTAMTPKLDGSLSTSPMGSKAPAL